MAEIVKIGVIGILGTLAAVIFKQSKPEYSTYIGIGLALLLFGYGFKVLSVVWDKMLLLQDLMGDNGVYLSTLLKVVGITYVCEFSSGVCKDAGFAAVAAQIEIIGKISVLAAGIPVFMTVIAQIKEFV